MGADGQVTVGELVMKAGARKVRRLYHDEVLVGFSGATADAFALFERFERQLEHYHGNARRAAVELAREWRGGAVPPGPGEVRRFAAQAGIPLPPPPRGRAQPG